MPIRAAIDAFERSGPAGVAIVPLARQLGVTRGSFYWHFKSRDELLVAASSSGSGSTPTRSSMP